MIAIRVVLVTSMHRSNAHGDPVAAPGAQRIDPAITAETQILSTIAPSAVSKTELVFTSLGCCAISRCSAGRYQSEETQSKATAWSEGAAELHSNEIRTRLSLAREDHSHRHPGDQYMFHAARRQQRAYPQ